MTEETRFKTDALLFADVLQWKQVSCPKIYQIFLIQDILGMTRSEIQQLTMYEYASAYHYALTTYIIRGQIMDPKNKPDLPGKPKGKTEVFSFSHPPGFDIDPKFVSRIGVKKDE